VIAVAQQVDRVRVLVRERRIERVEGPAEIAPEADLCLRAARLLQTRAPGGPGATIRLRKRIPTGGGLGGGSSDAATVLLALNAMWGVELPLDELAALGLELGADVPVFVRGSSAWAEGRGERLTPLDLAPRWFLIIHPGVSVGTTEIFQAAELTRNSPLLTIRDFLQTGAGNDCEAVVRARYRQVAEALDWLRPHAKAHMTGTGSCIFAGFEAAADAERVAARVPDQWTSFVVRGLNRSPLHAALASWRSGPG